MKLTDDMQEVLRLVNALGQHGLYVTELIDDRYLRALAECEGAGLLRDDLSEPYQHVYLTDAGRRALDGVSDE